MQRKKKRKIKKEKKRRENALHPETSSALHCLVQPSAIKSHHKIKRLRGEDIYECKFASVGRMLTTIPTRLPKKKKKKKGGGGLGEEREREKDPPPKKGGGWGWEEGRREDIKKNEK